jgi:hypothetical protein
MPTYKVYAETFIDAASEQEARDLFADNSWDFAARAEYRGSEGLGV